MAVGVLIDGVYAKSKKAIKEAVKADGGARIQLEVTSIFDKESGARIPLSTYIETRVEKGDYVDFVGPNPHTSRVFYGIIKNTDKGLVVQ